MATRRSKRIKVKAEENPPVAKAATEDSDSEPEYEEKRAVRAKAKPVARGRAVRGKRGSLADMPGMPLDIIFEILAYLTPLDLLHLSRTTKDFRALLMARSSLPFWKAARQNVPGLPECPTGLSEPEYACFVFKDTCVGCSKRVLSNDFLKRFVRVCKGCRWKLTVEFDSPNIQAFVAKLPSGARSNDIFRNVTPTSRDYGPWDIRYLSSEVESFMSVWSATAPNEQADLFARRKTSIAQLSTSYPDVHIFMETRKHSRADELAQLKSSRQHAIKQKLHDLDWSEELTFVLERPTLAAQFWTLSHGKETRQLTDRAWARVEDDVVKFLKQHREQRAAENYDTSMRHRFCSLENTVKILAGNGREVFPNAWQFAMFPEVRAIADNPNDTSSLTVASFDPIKDQMPQVVAEWKDNATKQLVDQINSSADVKLPPDADLGSLALGFFHYCSCMSRYGASYDFDTYPAVLGNKCTCGKGEPQDHYTKLLSKVMYHGLWQNFESWVYKVVQHIIEECGLDASSATVENMDDTQVRLTCATQDCQSEDHREGVLAVYTWRSAFKHAIASKRGETRFKATVDRLSETDMQLVYEIERVNQALVMKAVEGSYSWTCSHCTHPNNFRSNKKQVMDHLRVTHKLQESQSPEDLFIPVFSRVYSFSIQPVFLLSKSLSPKQILRLPRRLQDAVLADQAAVRSSDD